MDTTAPTLDLSTTGTTGQNGWYVSAVILTPTASDATSGLYSLEATTDGVTWTSVSAPITLTDGIYTVQFRATDNAGNVSQTPSQQIKVDATTPSLDLNINGTRGQNDWYISSVTVMPNVSDVGSGVNKIEASVNNGASGTITSPLSFTDGVHSYKIRVTDNAGNFTETPILPMMVDTVPPAIAIYDDSLNLGDTLMYDLEDMMSGLWINRSVIEDEDEKYKKIVWLEEITGKKSNDNEIRWDGIFADGTKAAPGQYFITLKISDQAGNETMRTAIVEVTAFNSILPIPAFTPPVSTVTEPIPSEASTSNEQTFGGGNNGNTGTETTTTNGETVFASVNLQAGGTSSFSNGNQTTSTPISNPNILWGAAAAAMLGATLAEWQKKREEEAARLAALIASNAGQGDEDEIPPDVLAKRRGKVIAKNQAKRAQEQVWEAVRTQQQAKPVNQLAKIDTDEERLEAYKQTASYQARQESYADYYAKKEQEKQNAVSAARWAGVASVAQAKEKSEEKSSWQDLFEKWTSPAKLPSGLTYGKPQWVNTLPLTLQIPLELIYKEIDKIPPKISTSDNKILNGTSNAISFLSGATRQLTNDLVFGLPGFITGWKPENGNEFYQDGRILGRTLSTYYGYFEILVGGALLIDGAVKFVASVGGSIGCSIFGGPPGGAACATVSSPLVIAGTTEMVGGAIVAGHGGAVVWNNANNPLQIRGNLGSTP